jgi:hypothetical protein
MNRHFDCIVIGAATVGCAAMLHTRIDTMFYVE